MSKYDWLAVLSVAFIVGGVVLTIVPPKGKRAKWAWVLGFVILGGLHIGLSKAQQAEEKREREEALQADEKEKQDLRKQIGELSGKLDKVHGQNATLLEQNAQLKTKLETELPPPRMLTPKQAATLIAALRQHPSEVVLRNAPTFEANQYADQFKDVFRKAGWTLGFDAALVKSGEGVGIFIIVRDAVSPPAGAQVLAEALGRAGIKPKLVVQEKSPDPFFVYIGVQSTAARNANVGQPR